MSDKPRVAYGIFCESVRSERDGKTSLLGIWGRRCIVHQESPAFLPNLSFHAFIEDRAGEGCDFEVVFTLIGIDDPLTINGRFEAGGEDSDIVGHNLNVNLGGVPLSGPGNIVANITLLGEDGDSSKHELEIVFRSPE